MEETIALPDLPEAVAAEFERAFPQAEIQRVESIRKGERLLYEIKLRVQKQDESKRYELVFDADGKLLEEKIEGEEEED